MPHHQAGGSLIESAVVTAVAALTVGTALPSFDNLRQRQQLQAVAAMLETDLHLARSEAVARGEQVRLSLAQDGNGGACWWIHTGAKPKPECLERQDGLLHFRLPAGQPVRLQANSSSMVFDPVKGTVTPTGTVKLNSSAGTVHLVINVMGRVRSCTPNEALPGLARC